MLREKYVVSYKTLYMSAIVLNSVWMNIGLGRIAQNLSLLFIALTVFLVNWLAWRGYRLRLAWGIELEAILSGGRILTILLASTIVAADLVAWLSPVGWILWYKLMISTWPSRLFLYWSGCAGLLMAESVYMYSIIVSSRDDVIPHPMR